MNAMTFDIKYFGTPLSARITLGDCNTTKAKAGEGAIRRTLREMAESYKRYWDRIADTGIPARLQ
jgi:hypothetical protein